MGGINQLTKAHVSRTRYMQMAGAAGAWAGEGTGEMLQTTRYCSCLRKHLVPVWRKDDKRQMGNK